MMVNKNNQVSAYLLSSSRACSGDRLRRGGPAYKQVHGSVSRF
jgi:hypothetical protein